MLLMDEKESVLAGSAILAAAASGDNVLTCVIVCVFVSVCLCVLDRNVCWKYCLQT